MGRRELVLVLFLCGVLAANENSTEPFSLRLVGGRGRCQGHLQLQRAGQDWIGVNPSFTPLWLGHRVCAELGCGPAVSVRDARVPPRTAVVLRAYFCDYTSVINYFESDMFNSDYSVELSCSESVRLDGKNGVCSGSLQFRGQSSDQSWTGVCEGALDHRGAEVVCRELGCGPPRLQGPLSPLGQMFHCEGHESALTDCSQNLTDIHRGNCSTLQLTCAELVRLEGGPSRCEGTVEVKYGEEWRRAVTVGSDAFYSWTLETAAGVCRDLDCGSAVSTEQIKLKMRPVWVVRTECVKKSTVRDCISDFATGYDYGMKVVCSESIRLVEEQSICSGSLQFRAQSSNQSWTGVCEGALDHRGAEVVCRELGCGPPLGQGALSPLRQMFHCDGNESALIDCPRTTTHPETCPALTISCSELSLEGGSSRCEGRVEVNYRGERRRMTSPFEIRGRWTLEAAAAVCRDLDCGSAVFTEQRGGFNSSDVWDVDPNCVKSSAVRDCLTGTARGYERCEWTDDGTKCTTDILSSLMVVCSGHQAPAEGRESQETLGP